MNDKRLPLLPNSCR